MALTGSDIDHSDKLTYYIVSNPTHGLLSELDQSVGTVTYTPFKDYNGHDNFTFKVNDGNVDSRNAATVYIMINSINDVPIAENGTATTDEEKPLPITLRGYDIDGDRLKFSLYNDIEGLYPEFWNNREFSTH